MNIKQAQQMLEAKLPDLGEIVAFEDELEVKVKGKKKTIEPGMEMEVINNDGVQIELKCPSGTFFMTAKEYKANGGYLV